MDWPLEIRELFPSGVPSEFGLEKECAAVIKYLNARGISNLMLRRYNVISWLLSALAYRNLVNSPLYQDLKERRRIVGEYLGGKEGS